MVAPNRHPAAVPLRLADQQALAAVTEALARIRYGDIRITIHDGRLVQLDVTEKTRFQPGA